MSGPAFEMLWDCRYCGAQKLLGLTHRHCPGCGAVQDPAARYFPAEADKIAAPDHRFVGADVVCRYCSAPCSQRAKNCGRCGAPLAEGAAVLLRIDPTEAVALPSSRPPTPPRRPWWKLAVPIAALFLVAVTVLFLVWRRDEPLVVVGRSWSRSISVERFGTVSQSAWCDELPGNARDVTRRRAPRGSREVADGEDCATKKRDRGDGSFVEERVCTPRTKSETFYDEMCDFKQRKWSVVRHERAAGGAGEAPRWPSVALSRAGCSEEGCERPGARDESYTVRFRDQQGEEYRCDFAEPIWARYGEGNRLRGELRSLTSSLDCGSLRPR